MANIVPVSADPSGLGRGKDKITARRHFDDDRSDEEGEDALHRGGGGSFVVVPVGNVDEFESYQEQKDKPVLPKQKKGKWQGKGESLTTEGAIEFMLRERAQLDADAAALRRENEALRQNLERQQYGAPILSNTDPQNAPPVDVQLWKKQLEQLQRENEQLKLASSSSLSGSGPMGSPPPMPPTETQKIMMLQTATTSPLVQRGPLVKQQQAPSSPAEPSIPLASLVWDGGYLWKIPFNGKGAPEKRIISIKRAAGPGPFSKAVHIIRKDTKDKSAPSSSSSSSCSSASAFIYFPPTLVWYNSDKPGEIKNARELIVYEGAHVAVGHNTPAFWKLAAREGPLPRPELCFSVVTSTRSLDLSAEKKSQAQEWITALHELLVHLSPNTEWARSQLLTTKPVFDNSLENPPKDKKSKKKSSQENVITPEREVRPPVPPASGNEQRKLAIRKQLFAAVEASDLDILRSMLKARVPVNSMDGPLQDTPLMYACRLGHADVVQLCLEYGAKNDPHPDFGDTALHVAVASGQHACARVILEAAALSEADTVICNLTNEGGQTPLHVAASSGHAEIAELLLEHGAEIGRKDELDQTVLHVCAAAGHKICMALLLDQGGDNLIEAPDLGGNTALHHAALNGRLAVLRLLLETAADVGAKNSASQTAYMLATSNGHHQVSMLLLEYAEYLSQPQTRGRSSRTSSTSSAAHAQTSSPRLQLDLAAIALGSSQEDLYEDPYENEMGGAEFSVEIGDVPPSPTGAEREKMFDESHHHSQPMRPPGELPRPGNARAPNPPGMQSPPPMQHPSHATQHGRGSVSMAMQSSPISYPVSPNPSHNGHGHNGGGSSTPGEYRVLAKDPYAGYSSPIIGHAGQQQAWGIAGGIDTSPLQHPHGQPYYPSQYPQHLHLAQHPAQQQQQQQQYQRPLSARDARDYAPAAEYYSPISARERPAPAMFDGMQVNYNRYGPGVAMGHPGHTGHPGHAHAGYAQGYPPSPSMPIYERPPPIDTSMQQEWAHPHGYGSQHNVGHQNGHARNSAQGRGREQQQFSEHSRNANTHSKGHRYESYNPALAISDDTVDEPVTQAAEANDGVETFTSCGMSWAVYETDDGHTYFLSDTSHSQWEDPRDVGIITYDDEGQAVEAESKDGRTSTRKDDKEAASDASISGYHGARHRLHSPPKCPSPKASWSHNGSSREGATKANSYRATHQKFFPEESNVPDQEDEDEGDLAETKRNLGFTDDEKEAGYDERKGRGGAGSSGNFQNPRGAIQQQQQRPKRFQRERARSDISSDSDSDSLGSPSTPIIRNASGPAAILQGQPRLNEREKEREREERVASNVAQDRAAGRVKRVVVTLENEGPFSPVSSNPQVAPSAGTVQPFGLGQIQHGLPQHAQSSVAEDPQPKTRSSHASDAPEDKSREHKERAKDENKIHDTASRDKRVSKYLAQLESGATLRSVRRDMEAEGETREVILRVLDLADSVGNASINSAGSLSLSVESAGGGTETTKKGEPAPAPSAAPENPAPAAGGMAGLAAALAAASLRKSNASKTSDAKPESKNEAAEKGSSASASARDDAKEDKAEAKIEKPAIDAKSDAKEDINALKSDPIIGKYAKMCAMGVPPPSVQSKMKIDAVEQSQVNRLLRALGMDVEEKAPPKPQPEAKSQPEVREDLDTLKSDPVLGKYAKMAAMGVPHGSVQAKMKIDSIPDVHVNRLLRALGHDVEGGGESSGRAGASKGGLPPVAATQTRRVQLQNLHWNPIPEEKLKKSVWGINSNEEKEDIQDADLEELEKLFGSAPAAAAANKTAWAGGEAQEISKKQNVMKLFVLDGKRAQNVVIGLAQYKSVAPDHFSLLRAICSLDSLNGKITSDHLENLLPLLPTPMELKMTQNLANSQHPAEIFIRSATAFYPELPRRLQCFVTTCHFRANCDAAVDQARALIAACREVLSSDKLARLLQKLLAVGNIMNAGTYRGQASGFTVDSLLKMIQTKGTDKKTTLVDYMVKSLYDRKEERLLDVISDLAVLEGACRLSATDSQREFDTLDKAFAGLREELGRIKDRQTKGESLSPAGAITNPNTTSPKKSMSAAFLVQLEKHVSSFSVLMEDLHKTRASLVRNVEEVVEYFGEDARACETSSIFSVLLQFRRALMTAKDVNERRERMRTSTSGLRRSQSPSSRA